MDKVKLLVVGESVFKIHTHFKGFASYETGYVTKSLDAFTRRFEGTQLAIDFMPNHEVSLEFPDSVEALKAWDVVVLSDAPADSFLLHPDTLAGKIMPDRLRLIGDYVAAGGGFAMIGGWMSYGGFHGKAHYAYSPLARLLPVTIAPHDDRMETPEGVVPEVAQQHPILDGLPAGWPDFLGYNRVTEPSGEVLLRFPSGDPLLVTAAHGSGRIACFTSDILPHWGSPRFLDWPGYVPFWVQLFSWLGRRL